jgi:hypothetical protein
VGKDIALALQCRTWHQGEWRNDYGTGSMRAILPVALAPRIGVNTDAAGQGGEVRVDGDGSAAAARPGSIGLRFFRQASPMSRRGCAIMAVRNEVMPRVERAAEIEPVTRSLPPRLADAASCRKGGPHE